MAIFEKQTALYRSPSVHRDKRWQERSMKLALIWNSNVRTIFFPSDERKIVLLFLSVSSCQKSLCSLHLATFELFCKFFGDFWVYLGISSFSQRSSKIYGNRKFWRYDVVLELEFEVKSWQTYTKQLTINPRPFRGQSTVWWCSKPFFSFNPSLNFLNFT